MLTFPFEIELGGNIISIPDWMKAVIGLSLPIMANISEVVRGAVQSVPTGQWEASVALGLPTQATWMRIILPQAVRPMVPALGNYLIQLFREVPLLSTITVYELLNTANLPISKK